ncbi:MAG: 30S ribosomal protein S16 [Candidatus Margulisiibacteriota bacterium]|nr:30S ribosomal protein S16 [Candidatus Margulisiibacteriota bacterium]
MGAKIKLQRKGTKKRPIYNIIIQDDSLATKGMAIDTLGQYNPLAEPSIFNVDKKKAAEWVKKGAKPTERVRILLGKAGVLPPVDLASLHKRRPKAEIKTEAAAEGEKKPEVAGEAKEGAEPPKTEEKKTEEPKVEEKAREEVKEAPKS